MTLSTRDLQSLGPVEDVRKTALAQAVLAQLLFRDPEQHYRHLDDGVVVAGTQNGQGDDLLLLFAPEGALIRGFDHESPMSPYNEEVALAHLSDDELEELSPEEELEVLSELRPFKGVLESVPPALAERLVALDSDERRPVPVPSGLTFCVWRTPRDDSWLVGEIAFPEHEDPDGSAFLLRPYAGGASAYHALLEASLGRVVSLELVERVYAFEPLGNEDLAQAREGLDPSALAKALAEIGYPSPL